MGMGILSLRLGLGGHKKERKKQKNGSEVS